MQSEPSRVARFRLHVARDTLLLFVVVQSVIAAFAIMLHAIDRAAFCPRESDWAVPCNTSVIPHIYCTLQSGPRALQWYISRSGLIM